MNRPLTSDESTDMRGLVLRCVAEAERDRLICRIVHLEQVLRAQEKFRQEVVSRTAAMLAMIEKTIDAREKFCDTQKNP